MFYCLQNITLVKNKREGHKINVVDGQQRLTTITLVLAHLGGSEGLKNKLIYAVRQPSDHFLQELLVPGNALLNAIAAFLDFDAFLALPELAEADYDYQDIYHMFIAVKTIQAWFKNPDVSAAAFKAKLLRQVKLIINRIDNIPEEELFMNLNAGKVQLDGADLARAILITLVAKQEVEEYDQAQVQDVVRVNERRIRIGWELDEINAWWSNRSVYNYFNLFSKIGTGDKETIFFNQEKHPIDLLYKLWVETKGKTAIRLGYFETKKIKARVLYSEIIALHRTLQDWFKDQAIYHYLGYLFSQTTVSFKTIWNKWTEEKTTRETFKAYLISRMRDFLFTREEIYSEEVSALVYWTAKMKDHSGPRPTNWYESGKLEKFLLMLDVIEHARIRTHHSTISVS